MQAIYKEQPPAIPVAKLLSYSIAKYGLSKKYFDDYLVSRSMDFDPVPFSTVQNLTAYCQFTHGSLLSLSLECLKINDVVSLQAANHLGTSYGMYLYLRSIPFLIAEKKFSSSILPADLYKQVSKYLLFI